MEKPIYPSPYMRITQGYNEGTHVDSYAIDEAGMDGGIDYILAPFTGIIKKIYTQDANEVWLESVDKVEYPDGTIDYMTVMFAHTNNIDGLFIGKKIKQKEKFYFEGTKGNATGNHCHIECGQGKFTGSGWHENSKGYWVINNSKKPTDCFWIDDSITILDSKNYTFKKIIVEDEKKEDYFNESLEPSDDINQSNDSSQNADQNSNENNDNYKLIFTCSKDDIYAIELKNGDEIYLRTNI